ncbi:hypothetical protein M2451_004059 [Dysgonomonas sp. PFB1-18]|uniref:hypothetical protein n=1 Tax=unclassified Dysgonomonas TaxID=2630389 RepID=UPI002473F578|nr:MULTISPECIES: hypothetical protein [unclassified Dysgonomonas]MDH6310902.1 hypothetical protein [Dysgonomonas sp. PF1-14]MDH6341029.1 hypothetical protein [Dysgonomonas sp. PF1-16]MDH6382712.1 hypothetical protein [Dysgonomonas sp. PFB1-18]MDH6400025.1 hypothetical protein [Dysgonomonas sp. PF1-23]
MKTSELLKQIEQAFAQKLEEKTGWGRNEIKAAYRSAVNETLMEITDKIIENEE